MGLVRSGSVMGTAACAAFLCPRLQPKGLWNRHVRRKGIQLQWLHCKTVQSITQWYRPCKLIDPIGFMSLLPLLNHAMYQLEST